MGCGLAMLRDRWASRWTVLLVGCLQYLITLSPMTIGATATDLKHAFNMTQRQYGVASSVYFVSQMTLLPFGPVLDRFGGTVVSVMAVLLAVPPHITLAVLPLQPTLTNQPYLIYALFMLGGLGMAANSAVVLWANTSNFPGRQHGRLIGVILGVGFLSITALNTLYTRLLAPSITHYFTVVAALSGVTFTLGVIFNVKVESVSPYEPVESRRPGEEAGAEADGPFWGCPQLLLLLLFCGIGFGVVNSQLLWISTYVSSLGYSQHMATILGVSPLVSSTCVVIIGFLSDVFLDKLPRMNIYCILNVSFTFVLLFSIFFVDTLVVLVLLSVANGVMVAASNNLALAELHVQYGEKAFGAAMGLFYLVGTSMFFICQYTSSVLYEQHIDGNSSEETICTGRKCFTDWTMAETSLFAICVILNLTYIYRQRHNQKSV